MTVHRSIQTHGPSPRPILQNSCCLLLWHIRPDIARPKRDTYVLHPCSIRVVFRFANPFVIRMTFACQSCAGFTDQGIAAQCIPNLHREMSADLRSIRIGGAARKCLKSMQIGSWVSMVQRSADASAKPLAIRLGPTNATGKDQPLFRPLPECNRVTWRCGTVGGTQPAMIRAHARASASSVTPGNSRRSSTAAESSPP
jgi:hypothetical protein